MTLERSQVVANREALQAAVSACEITSHSTEGGDCSAWLQFRGASHTGDRALFNLEHHADASFVGIGEASGPVDVLSLHVGDDDDFEIYRLLWSASAPLDQEGTDAVSRSRWRILSMFSVDGEMGHPDAVEALDSAFAIVRKAAAQARSQEPAMATIG